jgi:hypothetical protein
MRIELGAWFDVLAVLLVILATVVVARLASGVGL